MNSSPRSAKRRKIISEDNSIIAPPLNSWSQGTPTSEARPLRATPRTYGSNRKRYTELDNRAAQLGISDVEASSKNKLARSPLPASARRSLRATQEKELEIENQSMEHTPTKRRVGRPLGSTKKLAASRTTKISQRSTDDASSDELSASLETPKKGVPSSKTPNGHRELESEDTIMVEVTGTGEASEDNSNGRTRSTGRKRRQTVKQTQAAETPNSKRLQAGGQRNLSTPSKSTPRTAAQNGPGLVTSTGRRRGRPPKNPVQVSTVLDGNELVHFDDIPSTPPPPSARSIKKGYAVARPLEEAPNTSRTPTGPKVTNLKRRSIEHGQLEHDPEMSAIVCAEPERPQDVDTSKELKWLLQQSRYQEFLPLLKEELLQGLTGKRRLPLVGLEDAYDKVSSLVEQTVVAGEGNSMLVIGPRGSAKTTLVETVLRELRTEHSEDFHIIRLNGAIHTDDKLALKEIWRQLGKEMQVDDGSMEGRSNYADTLASLLALLSHPAELSNNADDLEKASNSVIFVISEFELFTTHPRQTLLYNLFDIAQSRKAPIAVLGLTTKVDVVESLEKRVKSRFSHRYVYVPLPRTFPAYLDIIRVALLAQAPEGTSVIDAAAYTQDEPRSSPDYLTLRSAWGAYISALINSDSILKTFLRRIFFRTKSVPSALTMAILPVSSMTAAALPSAEDFTANALLPPDSKINLLSSLSELELSLLIASARLDVVLDTDICNFNMAYDEYTTLANKMKTQSSASGVLAVGGGARVWGKDVALGAWENLEELELLVPVIGASGSGGGDVGRRGKLYKVDMALEEIGGSGIEMSAVMAKWCKEI